MMSKEIAPANERKMSNLFERYLTVWVGLCIVGGIVLGKSLPIWPSPSIACLSLSMVRRLYPCLSRSVFFS